MTKSDSDLIFVVLRAMKRILMVAREMVKRFEETGAKDHLEALVYHPNEGIQRLANEILDDCFNDDAMEGI